MQQLPAFFPRVKGQAMTAAERQRRCRANGKGRHRGGLTGAQNAKHRRALQQEASQSDPTLTAVAALAPLAPLAPLIQPPALPTVPLSVSAMAA